MKRFWQGLPAALLLACSGFHAPDARAQAGACDPQDPATWQNCSVPVSCLSPGLGNDPGQCQRDFAAACDANNETVPVAGGFGQMMCDQMAGFVYPVECSPENGFLRPKACQAAALRECKGFMGGGQPFQDQFCSTFFGTFAGLLVGALPAEPGDFLPGPLPGAWPVDGPCNPFDPNSWGTCAPPPSCMNPGMGVNSPGQCQRDFAAACRLYRDVDGTFSGAFCDGMEALVWPAECGFSNFAANQPACQSAMAQQCKTFQGGGNPFQEQFCETLFNGQVPNPAAENAAPTAELTSNRTSGNRPLAVTFTVAMADPDLTDTPTCTLAYGDGASASGCDNGDFSHTYASTGTFTATLTVTDGEASASDTVTINVTEPVNTNPTATLGVDPADGDRPLPVVFTVGASDPDVGDTVTYVLAFGDGSPDTTGTASGSVNHTYETAGTFTATLTVTDSRSATATASQAITVVQNQAPTALLTGPATGTVNQALGFSGASSTDPDGDALDYVFDFGDGATAGPGAGSSASHAYATAGTYAVTLTVTDGRGGIDTDTLELTVSDGTPPPSTITAQLGADKTQGEIPLTVNFDASASTGPAGTVLDYTFVFGDGTQTARLATAQVPHTYERAGTYQAYVIVTDGGGNSDVSDVVTIRATVTVTVDPGQQIDAELMGNPTSGTLPLTVDFDASQSRPAAGASLTSYHFVFGDGTAAVDTTAPTARHVYTEPGTHVATVTVTDSQGNTSTASETITVGGATTTNSQLRIVGAQVGTAPFEVTFDGSGSTAAPGATLTGWTFRFGDGSPSVTRTTAADAAAVKHTYQVAGSYEPTLCVTDSAGGGNCAQAKVKVVDAAPAPQSSGGALGLALLLPLVSAGLARRWRQGSREQMGRAYLSK